MNKYLKVLALTTGVLAGVAPTAINMDNHQNNDLGAMYGSVQKMQSLLPKLSRIQYNLNIDLPQNENVELINSEENTTSENTTATNQETINYLNETLIQVNSEYEQLKQTLINSIKETMDYLDKYKNGEIELTNEQKVYIKEQSNTIKYLAETLEDLSEDILCCIDGCENCEDEEEFNTATTQYLSTINELDRRIQVLQNTINSLNFIRNISNPYFYSTYMYYPNHIMPEQNYSELDNTQTEINNKDTSNNTDITNENTNSVVIEADNTNQQTNNEDTTGLTNNETANTNTETSSANVEISNANNGNDVNDINEDESDENKPTTFGLKPNIDTYAPTKRNIDTFYNTALRNNDYMYGGGGYFPYGGYGYNGYGMPYGGNFGNPYGYNGLNSNIINREVIENDTNNQNTENEDKTTKKFKKSKKNRVRKAKNIDTYKEITVNSNVNTMGESKLSNFFKQKLNILRTKIQNRKNDNNNPTKDLQEQSQNIDKSNSVVKDNEEVSKSNTAIADTQTNNNISQNNIDNKISKLDLKEEPQIHAR